MSAAQVREVVEIRVADISRGPLDHFALRGLLFDGLGIG